jgi:hypothetical protein
MSRLQAIRAFMRIVDLRGFNLSRFPSLANHRKTARPAIVHAQID